MVLIVDDKQENLFSLKTLLMLHLYEVDTAMSGEEALKKILKNDYALIILDVQMPEMDGYEVAETITGYSKTKNIPIIFLSAVNIDKRFITKGYASGGVDYITKPFDPDLLLLKVKIFQRLYEQNRELIQTKAALEEEIETRRQAQKSLEEVNLLLEERVQERTRDLLLANKELEMNNTELQQYASVASHDLQEPLRKIITYSMIIQERHVASIPEANKFMDKVISSAERMRNLIYDLLNYSKLSVAAQFSLSNLNHIIQDSINDLELSIEEKGAIISVDAMPEIEVIPGQIRQVFQNIISNALKFSKKEAPPVIKVWSELAIDNNNPGNPDLPEEFLHIYIQDNGIGFNEVYLNKMFTLFQRLHKKDEYGGTGIGLAIVKKIIEKHNGRITAKGRENEGSTFIIILPTRQKASFHMV